jgi:hypothetical protein
LSSLGEVEALALGGARLEDVLHRCFGDVVEDLLLHVDAVLEAARHVALVGEEQEVVGFAGGDEGVDEAGGVAEVDVLVDHAVDEQELAGDAVDVVHDGAALVALGVVRRAVPM